MKPIAAAVCTAACSVVLALTASVRGQALVERVPEDALVYVGWSGADALREAYGPTHLKAVVDQTRVRDLFGKYLDEVEAKVVKASPESREAFRVARLLAPPMWRYPTATFVTVPPTAADARPTIRFAVLSKAGGDASRLAGELTALLARAPAPPVPLKAFALGDVVCLSAGYELDEMALAGEGRDVGALGASATFADAMKQVGTNPAIVTYVDAEAVVAAAERRDPEAKAKVTKFLDAWGLRTAKAYIKAGGFDGADWVDRSFLSAAGERRGLFAAMPSGPTDERLTKAVPADATFLVTGRFDAAAFVRATRAALGETDADALKYFNMGLSGAQQALGTNVLDNLLEPLGADWAVFNAPRTGAGLLGMVAVNTLDDPAKMKKGLTTASVNLTNWINVAISKNGGAKGGLSVHGATTKIGDVDVYYLATPGVAPSWAIKDGRLFVGLYPQNVGAAARQAAKNGPSISDNAKYQALVKRLGAPAAEATSFFDLQNAASHSSMYPQIMAIVRYAGFGDLFGLTLPEPLLPPIDVLVDHLAPAGSVSWSDASGFHKRSVTPFPGALIVSDQGAVMTTGAGTGALLSSILLPSLNRARETANRVKSASNLRQIGTGMMLYANENRGAYPADIETLLRTEGAFIDTGWGGSARLLVNPRADDAEGVELGDDADAAIGIAADLGHYVYVGEGLKNTASPETIVAYENPEGLDDGINVLFADGHVDFVEMGRALDMIEAARAEREAK